jgi:type IV secretory pathway protease TraF
MDKYASPYYPPRARWYARLFYLGLATRHKLSLDKIYLPRDIRVFGLLASILIPGLGVYFRGPRLWGRIALSVCVLLFFCFIIWLGYPFGNIAFGLMISIHVTGFTYYCSPCLREKDFAVRMAFTVLVLIGIGLGIFMPIRNAIQNHLLLPLRVNSNVIVVGKFVTANQIRRGDSVAYTLAGYRFSNHWGSGASDHSSVSLGTVLAVAGDHVEFSAKGISVNGVLQAAQAHMPTSGTLIVPKNSWFIWPKLSMSGNWDVGEQNISSAMMQLANVSETQFAGKPFEHWFWRKQILP